MVELHLMNDKAEAMLIWMKARMNHWLTLVVKTFRRTRNQHNRPINKLELIIYTILFNSIQCHRLIRFSNLQIQEIQHHNTSHQPCWVEISAMLSAGVIHPIWLSCTRLLGLMQQTRHIWSSSIIKEEYLMMKDMFLKVWEGTLIKIWVECMNYILLPLFPNNLQTHIHLWSIAQSQDWAYQIKRMIPLS